ncbi:MAG TPA: glycoside hydrolase family 3 C-terminal domain-containing protein, partial [Puia sp.]|nr:glycoside hydrolase family 3 C-terminal domain-containing protein [Puia sp.]
AKYKLGLFDDPYRRMNDDRAAKEILSVENRKAAREIAAHSFVLLKNANQTLPLKRTGTIALVGPLANSQRNMLGTWSVSGDFTKSVTVLDGIKNLVGSNVNIIYAKGANISDDPDFVRRVNVFGPEIEVDKRSADEMINEAIDAANKSDVVVAIVGEAADMTGESSSMANINLQESQENLLKALAKTGKPVVVVLFNGRPMTLNWENEHANAVLDVWFGGTEAGNAIADVLFGNYNPSGKLSVSFPRSVGQIPVYYNHKNTGRPYHGGSEFPKFKSNYLDESNDPLYPFGYGLSYTRFSYSDISLDKKQIKPGDKLHISITVTNTGNYDGEETAQLYIHDLVGSVTQPVKELKKFQKVFLKKGESKTLVFSLTADDLRFFNSDLKYVYEPGDFKVFVGTSSNEVKEADFTLTR